MELSSYLRCYKKLAVAFSGGVDSAYLIYAAKHEGCQVQAYFVKSPFQPEFELEDAKELATQLEIPLKMIELNVLEVPEVVRNPENRCYYCKKAIFHKLKEITMKDGYEVLVDGTNASDEMEDRPGMKALAQLQILSPLRECGLSKVTIRQLSKEAGLFTWKKPSYACLATRIPTGQSITNEQLQKIEKGEQKLMEMGFSDFRIRIIGEQAKIQLTEKDLTRFIEKRKDIYLYLSQDFESVVLDLKERAVSD